MGYIVITHSPLIEKALGQFSEISETILLPHLITDVSNVKTMAENPYVKPQFENCRNIGSIRRKLLPFADNPQILIAFEPRHDASAWAQQIGGIMRLSNDARRYMPLRRITQTEINRLLYSPEPMPTFYPGEWTYMRMTETAVAANINAICSEKPILKQIKQQNIYSLFLLHKITKTALSIKNNEYILALMDSYSGTIVGRNIPYKENKSSYTKKDLAEKAAEECRNFKFEKIGEQNCELTLYQGTYPLTATLMGASLRKAFNPFPDIINTLYSLYLGGTIEYPFSFVGGNPAGKASFLFDALKLSMSEKEIEKALKFHAKSSSVFPTGENVKIRENIALLIDFFVLNALREPLRCKRKDVFYSCGELRFMASEYKFHNLSASASQMLSIHYPSELTPKVFCAYPVCLSAQGRIPFCNALSFAMQSPNLLKWLSALKYLLDLNILYIEGEDIVLSEMAIDTIYTIDGLYGPLFEDEKFLLFDKIHNDIALQKSLFFHIVSKLPNSQSIFSQKQIR